MRFRITSLFLAAAMLNGLAQEGSASANIVSVSSHGGSSLPVAGDRAHISFDWNSTNAGIGILGHAEATATEGFVTALARASAEGIDRWHTYQGVGAHAESVYDDIIITAPGDVTVTSVNATAHFHVEGTLITGGNSDGGTASVDLVIQVGGKTERGTLLLQGEGPQSATGIFAGSRDATGLGFDVGVTGNIPVGMTTVLIGLNANVEVDQNGAPPGIAAFAESDFSHTVSFATDRPVFDLPEGWTVNSVSANIVNNYWIPPAAVPEPTSAMLAMIAAGGAISVRRKRGPNSRSTNIVRRINSR